MPHLKLSKILSSILSNRKIRELAFLNTGVDISLIDKRSSKENHKL